MQDFSCAIKQAIQLPSQLMEGFGLVLTSDQSDCSAGIPRVWRAAEDGVKVAGGGSGGCGAAPVREAGVVPLSTR